MAAAGFALIAALLPAGEAPRPLLWPLPIREGCTSSFGEFRGNHLHGGVDFRTHKEEGWPVFAAADGAVERIRREPHGYGRVLYLKMDDGRVAVYAHLIRFESGALGLEEKLQAACAREGTSFPGDVWISPPVRVKAGDVVAYSGELGVGFPHLHFEVRRDTRLFDPFLEGLPIPDGAAPPVINGLAFIPLEPGALVEGSLSPVTVDAFPDGSGGFALAKPVAVQGKVGVELLSYDSLGAEDNSVAPARVEARLDGAVFYSRDLPSFDLAETKQGGKLWDPERGAGGVPAIPLWREAGFSFPGVAGEGLALPSDDLDHRLEVTASNRAGLSASLKGVLLRWKDPPNRRLALPGSGYDLRSSRIERTGLVLEFHRDSEEGVTPILAGGLPPGELIVEELSDGRVRALLPPASLPKEGAAISVGGRNLPFLAASGPGGITAGRLRLHIPDGAVGTALAEAPDAPRHALWNTYAVLRVGPRGRKAGAAVSFPGVAAEKRLGVCSDGGAVWIERYDGSPAPFRSDGAYCLKRDHEAPEWGKPRTALIPHLEARELRVRLRDEGSGVDIATLRVKLDGKPVYPDWDGDSGDVRLDLSRVPAGKHQISGSVLDRAGNLAALKALVFSVRE